MRALPEPSLLQVPNARDSQFEKRQASRDYLPGLLGRMRAVSLERHGKPEVLRMTHLPSPLPSAGEVRVKVRAIGINFPEVLSRLGIYGWAPKLPYTPGMEAYGEIDQVGAGVSDRRIGEPGVLSVLTEGTLRVPRWAHNKDAFGPPRGGRTGRGAVHKLEPLV